MRNYSIYRRYEDGRKAKLIYRKVSLLFAKVWCKNPVSHGETKDGIKWMDTFKERKSKTLQQNSMTPNP